MVFSPDDQSNVIVEVEGQVVTGAEREQRPQITMSPQFTWQGLHQKSNYCFARGEAATEITLFVALIKGLPTPSRFYDFIWGLREGGEFNLSAKNM